MPTKSFKSKIADLTVDTIPLSTNNGSTGYRIKNFNIISAAPGNTDYEHVVKIYSIPQTTASIDGNIDKLGSSNFKIIRTPDYFRHVLFEYERKE